MKSTLCLLLGVLTVAARGQTAEDLRAEAKAVEAQLVVRRSALRDSPQVLALRDAAQAAETAFREAVEALPAVQSLDRQTAELRAQLRTLALQRDQTIEKDESLQGKRQAREQASQALREALVNDPALLALRQRCMDLHARLAALETAGGN